MRTFFGLSLLLGSIAVAVAAEPIRCSAFLHGADGSWRSVIEGDVLAPNGTVQIRRGEILRPTAKGPKGDVARALNGLCEGG